MFFLFCFLKMEIISRGITVYDFTFQVYLTAAKLWQTMISIKKYLQFKMLYYDARTLFNSVENKKRWEEMYFSEDNVMSVYLMKMSKIGKNKQHLAINMNTLMGSETHILCSFFLLLFLLFSSAYCGYGCWIWAIRWQTTLKLHQFAVIFTLKMFFSLWMNGFSMVSPLNIRLQSTGQHFIFLFSVFDISLFTHTWSLNTLT